MEKIKPVVGDAIKADRWRDASLLIEDDGFRDYSFPGCMFRVKDHSERFQMAVNVITTGEPKLKPWGWQSRCKIEFVQDGEPSIFSGGILYHHVSLGKNYSRY